MGLYGLFGTSTQCLMKRAWTLTPKEIWILSQSVATFIKIKFSFLSL